MSAALQAKSTSCGDVTSASEVCNKTLNEMRNDDPFKAFFEDVVEKSRETCDDPCLRRQRQPPKRIDQGEQAHAFETVKQIYRQIFYETVDLITEVVKYRFDQDTFRLPKEI